MKIQNETQWSTRDLRSLILAAMREVFPRKDWRFQMAAVRVTRVTQGRGIRGRAGLGGAGMWLGLPDELEPLVLAHVVMHEVQHWQGAEHKDTRGGFFHYTPSLEVLKESELMEWARPYLNIRRREPKVMAASPKEDLQEVRQARVLRSLAKAESKLKYYRKRVESLRAKAQYYERALAAKKLAEIEAKVKGKEES